MLGWVSEWVSEWVSAWISERGTQIVVVHGLTRSLHVRVNGFVSDWSNAWMLELTSACFVSALKWKIYGVNKHIYELQNKPTKQRRSMYTLRVLHQSSTERSRGVLLVSQPHAERHAVHLVPHTSRLETLLGANFISRHRDYKWMCSNAYTNGLQHIIPSEPKHTCTSRVPTHQLIQQKWPSLHSKMPIFVYIRIYNIYIYM